MVCVVFVVRVVFIVCVVSIVCVVFVVCLVFVVRIVFVVYIIFNCFRFRLFGYGVLIFVLPLFSTLVALRALPYVFALSYLTMAGSLMVP